MGRFAGERGKPGAREAGSLLSIQVLRAIAALVVILPHINREFEVKFALPDALPLEAFKVGNIGVDLFFVISGFIMVYVSEGWFGREGAPANFLARRFARIVPLYWASSALLLAFVLVTYRNLGAANMSVGSVIASFAFFPHARPDGGVLPINAIGWTLNYEMFFYAVFSVALLASRRTAVIAITLLFAALAALGRALTELPDALRFWTDPIILEFVLGMWIAIAFRRGWRLPRWATWVLLAAALAMIAAGLVVGLDRMPRVIERGVPAALMVAALALASAPPSGALAWRGLGFLGDASYALYLTHPVSLTLPRRLFPGFIDPAASPWLYAMMLIAIAVAVAIAVHLLYEKPATRWLQARIAGMPRLSRPRLPADGLQPS